MPSRRVLPGASVWRAGCLRLPPSPSVVIVAEHVQKVILDLERKSNRPHESGQRIVASRLERGQTRGRHQHARADQRASFAGVRVLDVAERELLALGRQIDRLPASHAARAARLAQKRDQAQPRSGLHHQGRIVRQYLKRE